MVADDSFEPQVKAKLDDSELSDDLPKALQKVDLDLDDAPFLEDEEEQRPAPEAAAPGPEKAAPVEGKKPSRKKLLLIGAAGLVLLLAGAAAFLFFTRKPPEPQAPPPPAAEPAPAPAPAAAPEPTPPPPEPPKQEREIVMSMAPFLVEMTDAGGHTRFLTVRFTAVTMNPAVELEFKRNIIVLRDAVYYYLKNKNMGFLTDKDNTETIKKDVLSVLNQFIGGQPLDNLLIEEFLVK